MQWSPLLLTIAACLVQRSAAVQNSGTTRESTSWVFLEKFIFSEGMGTVELEAVYPASLPLTLALYFLDSDSGDNEVETWRRTVNGPLTCSEKLAAADYAMLLKQDSAGVTQYDELVMEGETYVHMKYYADFVTLRSRFLFAALGSCAFEEPCGVYGCDADLDVTWALKLQNGDGLLSGLNAGETGIACVSLTFAAVYALWTITYFFPVLRKLSRLAVQITLSRYQAKRRFYGKFRGLAGLWMLAVPFTVAALRGAPPYKRWTVVFGIETLVMMFFQLGLAMLYNPDGAFGSSFPFHATTTHMIIPPKGPPSSAARAANMNRDISRAIDFSMLLACDMMRYLEEIDPAEKRLLQHDEDLPGLPQHNNWTPVWQA
ncbi:Transmembrane protein 145 [Hondaea fermentalgiana]|uniref:Transmembrane protein 145 n=1 Tax=Hondaea fermentalgiana TaxID=2315210 RepID=A0A2R5GF26_9STRA|nr:Transmembrane protein 145 [Hondaea fermentalgiana]|eukprot:GBG27213.1 Transmembrane protein 145 [Hondaea fermentalgiana]